MKKSTLIAGAFLLLGACAQQTETKYIEKECPSCNPPTKHVEVVTECTDYQDTQLSANRYAQCRYCTNKFYEDGVDVTAKFMGQNQSKPQGKAPCRMPKKF